MRGPGLDTLSRVTQGRFRIRSVMSNGQHSVIFLPHLRLTRSYVVAGVEFVPLRDGNETVSASLRPAAEALEIILSGYVGREGRPLRDCVVATIPGRGWDLARADFDNVRWAASLLFLASWARNEYFPRFAGDYVNATQFRVVGQSYSGDLPGPVSFGIPRRDGETTTAGYDHGEAKFYLPIQVTLTPATVDDLFLAALDDANSSRIPLVDRLRTALPFVEIANSDDEFLTWPAQAILMGSAFEQLFRGDGSAYKLSKRFGDRFKPFGNVTLQEAWRDRPGVAIDQAPTDVRIWKIWKKRIASWFTAPTRSKIDKWLANRYRVAQLQWPLHRHWIAELYDVRSKAVHEGAAATAGGWSMLEHLVMGAFVFPLAVKLLLENDNRYVLSEDDRVRCLAIDKILASPKWAEDRMGESETSWTKILSNTHSDIAFERALAAIRQEHPELFRS